ncbi:uncharacterized protein TNCV_930561 [Trichonephila clavipes]|uniref:Uncharacterized protein n=1 Tax=Trichonephila clavipes TaxID=2585209 RepID=A0A8X6W288_TRICX|nr:uncharacterized protein TNCV_930561 [Trichonephila clavipes]
MISLLKAHYQPPIQDHLHSRCLMYSHWTFTLKSRPPLQAQVTNTNNITWTNRHRLKRDSPFSRMQAMDLLDQDIEEHFLKNVFNPQKGLPRVHFKPEMGAHTSKNQDPPEYLRQLALEIINKIPATAMQIYTDGSKDEQNSCGSGIFI